ncbi:Ureidoglycolate dehydrogenase [Listeria booriae]|nr:Ureidoglycolate dehydrogenase [Listeria booriae]
MRVSKEDLHQLIQTKIERAGLTEEHADIVADVLAFADARGIHSHGAVRVEYYSERIAKGGITNRPEFRFEQTGPTSGIFHGIMVLGMWRQNGQWKKRFGLLGKTVLLLSA